MQVAKPSKIEKFYQVAVVVSKAELWHDNLKGGNKVKCFVSARCNGCVLTTKQAGSPVASFQQRLAFPVFYPILNDKITMRLWAV